MEVSSVANQTFIAVKTRAELEFSLHVLSREPAEGSLHLLSAGLRFDVLDATKEDSLRGIQGQGQ